MTLEQATDSECPASRGRTNSTQPSGLQSATVSDEVARVAGFASFYSQHILPDGEWTGCADERLATHEKDHCDVNNPKIEVLDPMPSCCPADQNGYES